VSIPGTHTFVEETSIYDYIELSGGLTERANEENILVVSQNGTVKRYESTSELKKANVNNGDSVLVLPEVTGKNIQLAKSITQIMYQIAVSVGVLVAL
jgi:protein involved in polysaccharide export with SLBB domain